MSRKGLMEQDLSKLDVTKLHPLSPEVISRQATINIGKLALLLLSTAFFLRILHIFHVFCFLSISNVSLLTDWKAYLCTNLMLSSFAHSGTIGHVAHGKSTVVKAISGVQVLNSTGYYLDIHALCEFRKLFSNCN